MKPTDYDAGHGARIRVYVRKHGKPAPGEQPEPEGERTIPPPAAITLPRLAFLEHRLPGEDRWSREVIPMKVIE